MSDRPDFHVNANLHRHDTCLEAIASADVVLIVIDKRYGAEYHKDSSISITWAEYREAERLGKEILCATRTSVWNERATWKVNINTDFVPKHADNVKTFVFLDEIQSHKRGIWSEVFDTSVDLKCRLQNFTASKKWAKRTSPIALQEFSSLTQDAISMYYPNNDGLFYAKELVQVADIILGSDQQQRLFTLADFAPYSNPFFLNDPLSGDDETVNVLQKLSASGALALSEVRSAIESFS